MKIMKLYNWDTTFDFGKHKGITLKEIFIKHPTYISWCLIEVETFCITDDIFKQLTFTLPSHSKKGKTIIEHAKDWNIHIENLHLKKKKELNVNLNEIVDEPIF